jgi:hypothetical protein
MTDVLYVAGTLGFFGLMLMYVAGCARVLQAAGTPVSVISAAGKCKVNSLPPPGRGA